MTPAREKIVIIETDAAFRQNLESEIEQAGYDVLAVESATTGLDSVRRQPADLLLLDANLPETDCREVVAGLKGSAATKEMRIILLVGGSASERAAALDLGADDVLSRPWDGSELLARIRAQLRAKRGMDDLREKTAIAEQGQQIAHTAFEALAVTEKMTKDAFSLSRALKIGVSAVFVIAVIMAGIFFLFSHSARKDIQRANAVLTKLEGRIVNQQSLIARVRELRQQGGQGPGPAAVKPDVLQKQAADLKAKMATANTEEVASLQKQLTEINSRLKRIEQEGRAPESIIPADVSSVALLHVAVAFRHKETGQRLRYAGVNPQGEPLQDSDGNPVLTLEGRGPEVRIDAFGTAFLVASGGRAITNRHVTQPWWRNDEMGSLTEQGFQPEIASITAYFPGDARAFPVEIDKLSEETDLASVRVLLDGLSRSALSLDGRKEPAVSGEPVVLMGYATGLAAILARTDEDTAQKIIAGSNGDVSQILDELARRNLIRPLITQGHIGDVLPDKIVFDAQTTSGGSGGPLLNQQGKVIGVTYAVLSGFGGSNFGIPIRFTEPLLAR
jgi:DNA-binding response OmpR family regulator/S1-C subfamily serine protease